MPSKKMEKSTGNPTVTNGDVFQIHGALSRLIDLEEKMSVDSSYKLIKAHRVIAAEANALREALKKYVEYERKSFQAAQKKDKEALAQLAEQYAPEIREAQEFLNRPFSGTLPLLKLEVFKRADGNGVDITPAIIGTLMPILEE